MVVMVVVVQVGGSVLMVVHELIVMVTVHVQVCGMCARTGVQQVMLCTAAHCCRVLLVLLLVLCSRLY